MLKIPLLAVLLLATPGVEDKPVPSPVDKAWVLERILSKGSPSSPWGSYYAGKLGLKDCIPSLLELVTRENQRETGPVAPVKKAALDALISLDADVPAGLLITGLHKDYLAETLILLAMNPDKNRDALFCLMDYGPLEEQHWWAAAGVLASLKPQGLAERLLREVRFTLSITVRDPGSEDETQYFEGFGSGGMWGSTSNLFPPRPTYIFSTKPEKGAVVIQAKPVVIYYQRSEGARGGKTAGTVGPQTRAKFAIQFLMAMLGKPADGFQINGECSLTVDWIDEGSYEEKVDSHLKQLRSSYLQFLDRLCEQHLLTADDCRKLEPTIRLKVFDQRTNKHPPLPAVSTQE